MNSEWWLESTPEVLEQGDVFIDLPFVETVDPIVALHHATMKGGADGWMRAKDGPVNDGKAYSFLATGKVVVGLMLSHGCEIDKPRNRRCTFAQVMPLVNYPADQRGVIAAQSSKNLFYLPDVPGLGDMVADLRHLTSIPRSLIDKAQRAAAMTPEARARLQAQILIFILRKLPT